MIDPAFRALPNKGLTLTVSGDSHQIPTELISGEADSAEGYVAGPIVERRDEVVPSQDNGTPWDEGDMIFLRSPYEIRGFRAAPRNGGVTHVNFQLFNRAMGTGTPPGIRRAVVQQASPVAEEQLQELRKIRRGTEMALDEDLSSDDASDTGISN